MLLAGIWNYAGQHIIKQPAQCCFAYTVCIMCWGTTTSPPPHTPPGISALKCYWSQIAFYAVLKPLLLSPNDSVAAVTLENEALLYVLFIVFVSVMACIFVHDLL